MRAPFLVQDDFNDKNDLIDDSFDKVSDFSDKVIREGDKVETLQDIWVQKEGFLLRFLYFVLNAYIIEKKLSKNW